MPHKKHGIINWYNKNFGYGFIIGPEGEDVFFHHSVFQVAISTLHESAKSKTLFFDKKTGKQVLNMRGNRKASFKKDEKVLFDYETTVLGLKATKVQRWIQQERS